MLNDLMQKKTHAEETHGEESHDSSHDEHLLHQLQNKPWAALYVAAFFFFMISLGVLAFMQFNEQHRQDGLQSYTELWKE